MTNKNKIQWLNEGDWEGAQIVAEGDVRKRFGILVKNKNTGERKLMDQYFISEYAAQTELDSIKNSLLL